MDLYIHKCRGKIYFIQRNSNYYAQHDTLILTERSIPRGKQHFVFFDRV